MAFSITTSRASVLRRRGVIVCGTLVIIATAVAAWVYAHEQRKAAQTTDMPTVAQPAVRLVHALGRLEPRGTVLQLAPPAGNDGARVERLLVAEGDDVTAGQVVAVLDLYDRRQAAVAEAKARVYGAEIKLEQVRAGAKSGDIAAQAAAIVRMDAELDLARKEWSRAEQLTEQAILTTEALEQKKLALDRAIAELDRAKSMLESLREVRAVDVSLQQAEIATAAAALLRAEAELAATEVRAPANGRILKIHTHPGERLHNLGILQMGDVAQMQAVAEVFEGDVSDLQVGLPARIRLDSSGYECTGAIEQLGLMVARKDVLSNDPVSDTDARVVEIRISIPPEHRPHLAHLSNARIEVTIRLADESSVPHQP
jgi:HlyD family secretion protein